MKMVDKDWLHHHPIEYALFGNQQIFCESLQGCYMLDHLGGEIVINFSVGHLDCCELEVQTDQHDCCEL